MNLIENMRLAVSGLRSNKMRTFLTMLGIIIGISSVIAIVTVGNSVTASVTDSMASFGVNNIQVGMYQKESFVSNNNEVAEADKISDDMLVRMAERFEGRIKAYTVQEYVGYGSVQDGRLYANVDLYGVNPGYELSSNVDMVRGRFITDRDVLGGKYVAVVSDRLVKNMFPGGENPLGQEIKIHNATGIHTFSIVGVYKYEMNMFNYQMGSEEDIWTDMYLPVTAAQKYANKTKNYRNLIVMAETGVDPQQLALDLETYFEKMYDRNPRYGVWAYSMDSYLEEMTSMLTTVATAISIIAAISLLVGGIGVMNIMLVSVTERTREIGTRKALGARSNAIRAQFIVEAMIICLIGGVIGVVLGLILGIAGSSLLSFPATPDVLTVLVAVLFSMAIGVFFGFYPANKAAKLDPIEALRYE